MHSAKNSANLNPRGSQGAGRMALETQGSKEHDLKRREQEKRNLGAGSKKNWKREQGSSKILVLENGARSKGIGNYQGARGKNKKEHGARSSENW